MQLNPLAFNAFLGGVGRVGIGQKYLWRRAYACPCVNPKSGAALPSCPLCFGSGRQWLAAIAGVAGMASIRTQREWAQFGAYETGDAVITIGSDSPMYTMGQFDRVTALNATNQFSQVLVHDGGPLEKLLITVNSVDNVFWLNSEGTEVIQGGIPTVNSDGTLTWSSGAPPSNTQYTISGSKLLEYFCYKDFPSNRAEHQGAPLPKRVVIRDFDLYNPGR